MPLSSGTRLGPYEIVAPLGAGGMGEVYKARDTRLGREVALKVLPPAVADDPARRARFETEARAASALNHPGILTVFDIGCDNGVAYLVTEFIDGHTLRQVRPEGPRRQLEVAAQIAEALAAAHAAGITHRDLKPENVMVTRDGRAKVLDFGLARQVTAKAEDSTLTEFHTQPGTVLGTVGYMSPEQARGILADHRSDIFSFGAVLYELVTGQRAFQGDSAADTLSAVLKQDPPDLPAEIPTGVRQIVQHCLEKEPRRRFQSANDLAFALRALSGSSVAAPPVELPLPRRRPRVAWLAVPAAAIATGFIVHAWLFTPSYMDLAAHRYTPIVLFPRQGIEALTPLDAAGDQPAWGPGGKTFVYAARGQLYLRSLESPTSSQLTREPWPAASPVYSADGARVYYLGQEKAPREVWSVSTAGGTPERVFPSLGGAWYLDGLALSRDGKALVFAKLEDNGKLPMSLWISSPPGAPPRKYPGAPSATTRPYGRARLRFSPDGSRLLAMLSEREPYELWLLPWPPSGDSPGARIRRILPQIQDLALSSGGDWMPDGRHVILSRDEPGSPGGRLWLADVETGKLQPVSAGNVKYQEPAVNPHDGRILVHQVRIDEDAVEIPLDGSAPRDLVATDRRELHPAWSPVADQFVYVTDRRGDPEIWLASRKEGWHRPVVTQKDLPSEKKLTFTAPVWAPDGSRIAYSAAPLICISPIAGGPATPLLPQGANGQNPTWSPDGTWIAFREYAENKFYLSKQKVGSKEPHVRVSEAADSFRPAWSPDGKWITIQLPGGFGIVSPDGRQTKVIFRGAPGLGSACGWSRDSSILYIAYLKGGNLILSGFDVRGGAERTIVDLGTTWRFSYFSVNSALLSEAPDGKSLAGSLVRYSSDIWMLESVVPPPNFWQRLFWRPVK